MIFTRIQSIEINNDEWEALEEYLEKPRNEIELNEIGILQTIFGDEFWFSAERIYLYDKIDER